MASPYNEIIAEVYAKRMRAAPVGPPGRRLLAIFTPVVDFLKSLQHHSKASKFAEYPICDGYGCSCILDTGSRLVVTCSVADSAGLATINVREYDTANAIISQSVEGRYPADFPSDDFAQYQRIVEFLVKALGERVKAKNPPKKHPSTSKKVRPPVASALRQCEGDDEKPKPKGKKPSA